MKKEMIKHKKRQIQYGLERIIEKIITDIFSLMGHKRSSESVHMWIEERSPKGLKKA